VFTRKEASLKRILKKLKTGKNLDVKRKKREGEKKK